jgi:PAS domain S-box-containing protein
MTGLGERWRRGAWSVSLRTYVTTVMLVALLPLLGYAALSTWYSYSAVRHWAERDLMGDAEHFAQDIDARVDVSRMVMRLVALSPAARRGDLSGVREHIEAAQAQGVIIGALVRDIDGAVVMAIGFSDAEVQDMAVPSSDQLVVGRSGSGPLLVGRWPISSADPRLAQLDFAVSTDLLPVADESMARWPWHLIVVADRDGRVAWQEQAAPAGMLPLRFDDPAIVGGVLRDLRSPQGELQAAAFARAPRSGLIVAISQPLPSLYARMPFGPGGSLALAVVVVVLSLFLARTGAVQIHSAYRGGVRGGRHAGAHIDDAMLLGAELRRSRDRLFQAAGGIAVLELSREPGRRWQEARVAASPNAGTMLDLPAEGELTTGALLQAMMDDDRAAMATLLAAGDADAKPFTRAVRFRCREGRIRFINMIGMLRDPIPATDDVLIVLLQDVTAQTEAEEELRAQASRLRVATSIARLGVWERDVPYGIGHGSVRFWEIMGLEPRPDLPRDAFMRLVHPDDRARVQQAFRAIDPEEIVRDGQPAEPARQLRYRIVRPDGTVRHVRASRVVIGDGVGAPVRVVGVLIDETEAVLAQQALAASEARFRLAVEVAELGVFERYVDSNRSTVVWNERMWRMRGLEPRPEPPTYDELLAMVHPDDREQNAANERARRACSDGSSDYEFRIFRPDGEERVIHSRSVRTFHPEDGSLSVIAINQDITERRHHERAIAQSEAQFRLAVETAQLGVSIVRASTGRGTWNERLFRMCGLEPAAERPADAVVMGLIHPADRERMARAMATRRAGADGSTVEGEVRVVTPAGAVRILTARSVTLRDSDDATMLAVFQDVTERRSAEQAVADSELRLRLATEATGVGIWDHDPRAGTTVWTDEMWRLRGLERGPIPPPRDILIQNVVEQDRAILHDCWERLKAGEPALSYDYRVILPDGSLRWLHAEGRSLRDEAGEVVRLVGMVMDVTSQRMAALALQDKTTTLELAVEAADLGVWVRDAGVDWGHASARYRAMFGHPAREGRMSVAEVAAGVHPDDRAAVQSDWLRDDASAMPRMRAYRTLWPDGTVRHLQSYRAVLRDAAGGVQRLIGIVADVTEAKLATERLAASEQRLRLAVEAAELGVFDYDPDTREGEWSERTWRLRGLTPRPGIPTREEVEAIIHPGDRAEAVAARDLVFAAADGTRIDSEFRVVWADGTVRHVLLRALVRRPVGGPARVFGIDMDVTERRTAALALAASEARLQLAVETAQIGMFEFNPESPDGYLSARIWTMRGLEPRPGTLSYEEIIALVHPEDRDVVVKYMQRQLAEPDGAQGEHEFRIVRPDGQVRYLYSRAITQRHPDGALHRLFGINIDVTERRLAAQALEESEARLRLATEAAGVGVFQFGRPGGSGYWSDRMWRIRGLEPRPGVPTPDEAVATVHPEDRERLRDTRVAAAGRPHGSVERLDFRIVRPDGALRHLTSPTIVLRGRSDDEWTLIGVNADVTEQVEREQTLRETAARFELAIEAAQLALWEWDPVANRMNWSRRIREIVGIPDGEAVPRREEQIKLVHAEDRAGVPAAWIRSMGADVDQRGEGEFRVVRRDGSIRHVHWQGIPLRDAQGRVVRFAGVAADVTEARLAERALRNSEEVLRMALEAAELGVWTHDLATDVVTFSPRLWRICGFPNARGPISAAERIAMIHPEDRGDVVVLQDKLMAQPAGAVDRLSYRIVQSDGAVRTVERQAMMVRDPDGQPLRIVAVVRDVTEVRQMAAQVMAADKLATLGEMAGAIAHELAQPLQAIMATAATARMRLVNESDIASVQGVCDRLAWIERQIGRAGKTIQHLLAFSRGESSVGFCRLSDAVEGAMELVGHGLERARIVINIEVADDLPAVGGGIVEVEQVLVNLLTNARDAIGARAVRRIDIIARLLPDAMQLDVSDTGGGIPEDRLETIFEPFYTTKPVGRGTGIGLSVARRTMNALGGSITVANVSEGARFSLIFPRFDEER